MIVTVGKYMTRDGSTVEVTFIWSLDSNPYWPAEGWLAGYRRNWSLSGRFISNKHNSDLDLIRRIEE